MTTTMFPSTSLFKVLIITVASIQHASAATYSPCSYGGSIMNLDSNDCLIAVRNAAEDRERFWFGEEYALKCQNQSTFSSECYNPLLSLNDSLVSRLFRRKVYERNKLKTVLKIKYKTHTGSYRACGNTYEIDNSRMVHVDPLTIPNQGLLPFELVPLPNVSWEINAFTDFSSNSSLFTLAIIDAGFVTVNALYVNIAGHSLDNGQTIIDYHPPLNPTLKDNPYVFLLFGQETSLVLSPQWLHELSLRSTEKFEDFLIEFALEGPVGISWLTARADPYSADKAQNSPGNMNTCAHFVHEAFKSKTIPYLPKKTTELNVYLDITFRSPPILFSCCCNKYSYQASIYKPNPIGDGEANALLMREDATRSFVFHKSTAFPSRIRDFDDELHTLVMVDPDSPFIIYGSHSRPYVHMLVSNIREGNFKTGQVVLPYSGPWPPDQDYHTYYFLLFKQKENFVPQVKNYAFMNCSGIFRGRCGYNMAAMIQDGGLELVGASWQLIKTSAYVRCALVGLGLNETKLCDGVEGFNFECGRAEVDNNDYKNCDTNGSSYATIIIGYFINCLLISMHTVFIYHCQ